MDAQHPVAVVLGTRPEIIKLAGIIRGLGAAAWVIDTGQHYDAYLNAAFFQTFGLAAPSDFVGVGGKSRAGQIAETMVGLEALFVARRPAAVVVHGDTNSALGGALAANAVGVPIVHVEAGLRSFDRSMPEEHNRVLIDHLSDLCLAPTHHSASNLAAERIFGDRVVITGNTVVEAVNEVLPSPAHRAALLDRLGLQRDGFALATFHRPENVDAPTNLRHILEVLHESPVPVLLPLHPRTQQRAKAYGLEELLAPLRVSDPLPYQEFLALAAEAALLISDSGGVQEEASVLKRPLIAVRGSTERPEVQGTFVTLVSAAHLTPDVIANALTDIDARLASLATLPCPYGEGLAWERSVEAIERMLRDSAPTTKTSLA